MKSECDTGSDSDLQHYTFGGARNPIRISFTSYNGMNLIDIRKWFFDKKKGSFSPTQKGISLGQSNLESLIGLFERNKSELVSWTRGNRENQKDPSGAVTKLQQLGENSNVSVKCNYVQGNVPFVVDYVGERINITVNRASSLGDFFVSDQVSEQVKLIIEAIEFSLNSFNDEDVMSGQEVYEQFMANFNSRLRNMVKKCG